ncbi:hypothetical protein PIROE2DRAFT_38041 [Piromyces sp. E2]|nr:hypothetical protein PIROE2DRAFT_38041 [Piromyces sp. E2]|eukprot:OUM69593.1 hypothetical protein PIROE2DRAFT_38041 [Piromyces sp. E2]
MNKNSIVKSDTQNSNATTEVASTSTITPSVTQASISTATTSNPSLKPSTSDENYLQNIKKTRKDNLMIKKEKSWTEFLLQLDDYTPIIPDVVTDYYLARAGFESDNVKLKRLLSLAAQKFIADIATDAFQHSKIRQQNSALKAKGGKVYNDKRTVLIMDDLSTALQSYGINLKKPDYYM